MRQACRVRLKRSLVLAQPDVCGAPGSATYAAVSGPGSANSTLAMEFGGSYYQSATTPLAATDNFGMSFYVKASTFANDSYLVFNGYPYGNNGWGIWN